MIDLYLTAKLTHVLSSTVLFGTGIGTAFQMVWAMQTRRVETIHSVSSGVVVADWLFTTPAGFIQPLTGVWLAYLQGYSLSEPWLVLTYMLYVLAFACWLPVVILQMRIRNLAAEALELGDAHSTQISRLYRIWFILGWPAFGALVIVYWLMIAKPPLWS